MRTILKHPYTFLSIAVIALGAIVIIQAASTGTPSAIASKITDPDAKLLLEQADKASRDWQALDKEAQPLRDKLAGLEANQTKLAGGNAGRLYTLCAQYGIIYVRGQNGQPGTTKDATPADCAPLQ